MNPFIPSTPHPSSEYEKLLQEHVRVIRQLEASERLKSQFLSHIRNEIINPFGAILNLSESITQLGNQQLDKAVSMAALIHQEAFKLNFQLQNIFAAAEIEAGEITLCITRVDVPSLLESVIEKFRGLMDRKHLQLKLQRKIYESTQVSGSDTFPRLFHTDADKLGIILCNLIANAIEFSQPGELLEVSFTIQGNILQISIEDNGIGIAEKDLKVIFNRFTQLGATDIKHRSGHGLGLSVVKALLEALGGCQVVNSAIQSGSIFTITIPETPAIEESQDFTDGTVLFFNDTDNQESL